jgi:uncharacterized protein YegP (UPF0339 family)
MNARYELVMDQQGRFRFRLLDREGRVLLNGLPCDGKIGAQSDVLHARNSIRAGDRLVSHEAHGHHFVVLKDKDGSVLGRSPQVDSTEHLTALIEQLGELGTNAPLVDATRAARAAP